MKICYYSDFKMSHSKKMDAGFRHAPGEFERICAESRREVLVSSLNEFLYSSILAVKRTLGPEHESRVIESLKDVRPQS